MLRNHLPSLPSSHLPLSLPLPISPSLPLPSLSPSSFYVAQKKQQRERINTKSFIALKKYQINQSILFRRVKSIKKEKSEERREERGEERREKREEDGRIRGGGASHAEWERQEEAEEEEQKVDDVQRMHVSFRGPLRRILTSFAPPYSHLFLSLLQPLLRIERKEKRENREKRESKGK